MLNWVSSMSYCSKLFTFCLVYFNSVSNCFSVTSKCRTSSVWNKMMSNRFIYRPNFKQLHRFYVIYFSLIAIYLSLISNIFSLLSYWSVGCQNILIRLISAIVRSQISLVRDQIASFWFQTHLVGSQTALVRYEIASVWCQTYLVEFPSALLL